MHGDDISKGTRTEVYRVEKRAESVRLRLEPTEINLSTIAPTKHARGCRSTVPWLCLNRAAKDSH